MQTKKNSPSLRKYKKVPFFLFRRKKLEDQKERSVNIIIAKN